MVIVTRIGQRFDIADVLVRTDVDTQGKYPWITVNVGLAR